MTAKKPDPEDIAKWIVALCRMYGAGWGTSYLVAGLFVRDVEEARDG